VALPENLNGAILWSISWRVKPGWQGREKAAKSEYSGAQALRTESTPSSNFQYFNI
jgi:hypothetical protein